MAGPQDPPDVRSTFAPQFVRDCQHIDWRYTQATSAIRRDLGQLILATAILVIVVFVIRSRRSRSGTLAGCNLLQGPTSTKLGQP